MRELKLRYVCSSQLKSNSFFFIITTNFPQFYIYFIIYRKPELNKYLTVQYNCCLIQVSTSDKMQSLVILTMLLLASSMVMAAPLQFLPFPSQSSAHGNAQASVAHGSGPISQITQVSSSASVSSQSTCFSYYPTLSRSFIVSEQDSKFQ